MNDNIIELSLKWLETATRVAALPADQQLITVPKECDIPHEIAADFGLWCEWALRSSELSLTEEQRTRLAALNQRLNDMSGLSGDEQLWTIEGLQSRSEWDEVRREARRILELFQWPMESTDVPEDERDLLKQALRVAALPADQQIASSPPGSTVGHWIAGYVLGEFGSLLRTKNAQLTDEQRSALSAIYTRLDEISSRHEEDPELLTVEGLRRRPEWEEVRRDARKTLALFKWSGKDI